MSALFQAVQDYLEMRRALGYQLTEHGRVLPQFVAFLEQRDAPLITTELALEFATQPTHASVVWRHTRLAIVRGFAIYAQALDARHEVPPANLLPATYRRAVPYLYSDAEIDALMHAARALRPALRAVTCETLIGLLSVTGMRISEACGLDRGDVELAAQRLTIRRAKNGRSREIPLHPSTVTALEGYAHVRDELCPDPVDSAFFLSRTQARLSPQIARRSFDQLRRATGLARDTLGRHARIHDIRHTYVLRTLLGWYREESDIEPQLPLLSTFLGHVEPKHTFWYFEATPELLTLAAERLELAWDRPHAQEDEP